MGKKSTLLGSHMDVRAVRARAAFVELRGAQEALVREVAIAGLQAVEWRGQTLYRFRCHGTTGKGPHDLNVPLALLWALIDFRAFRCPYHS